MKRILQMTTMMMMIITKNNKIANDVDKNSYDEDIHNY